ncbi:hypothetical protein LicD family [Mycoplasmopsis californica HAZ160_1]|uniref:Cholinephosphotransferase n=2 Tax=Mycoplasmopsis californica TaxID=2113 RepID=A0A059XVN1_9BACT|nr:LicD family protein [Mycoplasmopsis californica]AIA29386.1 cholinephosphotransferase [Mycoplasmopsis californica]BAP01160.1 hypothetical protein LicD family [Mycoplasmopsis californica HAZ160_1]BBG41027.1 hypothetical protein LicD family [Mycoplasmopsis californica]BBG41620.1 hypothetical protein LicD family [Mycoplasmopsis californica]BBG42214.1 hypothetical protein LicD family [Mycoplasmopsis californica]
MDKKQKQVYELLKEFLQIVNKHNLQYMIIYGTLLGAKRHNGFIPWDDDIDLVVPKATLDFLVQNYPSKIYLPENNNSPLLIPKFSNDNKTNEEAVFIDLFLAIPTSRKNISKFSSLKNKIRYLHTYTRRKTFKRQWGLRILKFFSLFSWLSKKYSVGDAYNDLYSDKPEFSSVLYLPFKKKTYKNTYSKLDFDTAIESNFEDLSVKIPSNWEEILIQNYGKNWSTPKKFKYCEHLGLYDMEIFVYKKRKINN